MTGRSRLLQQIATLFSVCLLAGSVAAVEVSVPTRDDTLSGDLDGPAVDWVGEIVRSVRDDGDTCFLLRRMDGGGRFIACGAGAFEPSRFAAGRVLEVQGNLGPAMARQIAGEIFTEPVVAGAFIQLLPVGSPYYWAPAWYYDPFYYPYYGPYWGPGLHWWYWR